MREKYRIIKLSFLFSIVTLIGMLFLNIHHENCILSLKNIIAIIIFVTINLFALLLYSLFKKIKLKNNTKNLHFLEKLIYFIIYITLILVFLIFYINGNFM